MFFLQKTSNYKPCQRKTFSIAYRNDINDIGVSDYQHPLMCKIIPFARRTVFAPPISLMGSITLEAAILLPWFLLMVISLYSVMDMLRLHALVTWHLHQIGNTMCIYGCLVENLAEDRNELLDMVGDVGFSYLYVREQIEEKVTFPQDSFFTTISILEDGKIELVLSYNYPLVIPLGRTKEVWLQSRFVGHVWVGSDMVSQKDIAYIAENGEVYHVYKDCSYLQLQIEECPVEMFLEQQSASGKLLIPCASCNNKGSRVVYITTKQNKYHFDRECGGLRRTIYIKDLAWAMDNYELCQRCEERMRFSSE